MLLGHRSVPIRSTPLTDPLQRAAESWRRRLPLHHIVTLPRLSPEGLAWRKFRGIVQIGDHAWEWFKPLVFVRAQPSFASDPVFVKRFREIRSSWHRRFVSNNPDLLHIEDEGELFAVFEYDRGVSLDAICRAVTPVTPLPRSLAERILEAVYVGLRGRHELGLARGAVNLDSISVRYDGGVTVGIGRPWDPAARPREDIQCAERLSRELLARSTAIATDETLGGLAKRFQ